VVAPSYTLLETGKKGARRPALSWELSGRRLHGAAASLRGARHVAAAGGFAAHRQSVFVVCSFSMLSYRRCCPRRRGVGGRLPVRFGCCCALPGRQLWCTISTASRAGLRPAWLNHNGWIDPRAFTAVLRAILHQNITFRDKKRSTSSLAYMSTPRDTAQTWRDLADQLTVAQIVQLERLEHDKPQELLEMARQWVAENNAEAEFLQHVPTPAGAVRTFRWQLDSNWFRDFEGTTRRVGQTRVHICGRQLADGSSRRWITVHTRHLHGLDAAAARQLAAALTEAADEIEHPG
jgi:hypothetical protein